MVVCYPPVPPRVGGGVVVGARVGLGVPADGVVRVLLSLGPAGVFAMKVVPGVGGGWRCRLVVMA